MTKCKGLSVIVHRLAPFVALLLLLDYTLFGKRKDDVVVMNNGDKFTGEIKGLQYGDLIFKSGYMKDDVHLDWKQVKALQSQDAFIVTLSTGERVTGFIGKEETSDDPDHGFKIIASGTAVDVPPSQVIVIGPRERSFWDQLTGSISYGFGFSSGNNSTNSSLAADVGLNTTKNYVKLAASSQFDSQAHAQNTNRITFDSQYSRMLTEKWLAAGLVSLLKSNQQDLELRSTYGGGFGRRLIQTDKTALTMIGGLAYSHENYSPHPGSIPIRNNAEGLLGVTFSTFRFKTLYITSQTLLFPSLSDPGRFRISSQSNLRIELVRNFTWNMQLYENYDTRPPVNAPKNDLGVTTSLGWTF